MESAGDGTRVGGGQLVLVGADVLFGDGPPCAGQLHQGLSVHQAVAELIADGSAHSVVRPAGIRLQGLGVGRPQYNVLHVSPCQARVGLQGQRDDTGSQRGRGTRPGVHLRTPPRHVHCNLNLSIFYSPQKLLRWRAG